MGCNLLVTAHFATGALHTTDQRREGPLELHFSSTNSWLPLKIIHMK